MEEKKAKYKERFHRVLGKGLWKNMALLALPAFLICAIFVAMFYTYGVSIFLIYFILPMAYTVEKRMRYQLTGIGKEHFSYTEGYKDFFQSNKGGIFGILVSFVFGFSLLLFFGFVIFQAVPLIVHSFPETVPYFEGALAAYSKSTLFNQTVLQKYLFENGVYLIRPTTIYMGLVCYLPIMIVVFYFINENLTNHYLSGLILPDLDKNVSAAQARNVIRSTLGRGFVPYRYKVQFKRNWIYYVIYSCVYGLTLYAASFITVDNINFVPLIFMMTPGIGIIAAIYLNYFCLANRYAIVEESKDVLLQSIPMPMRTTIYQTYHSNEYIHGEESKARGCFIPVLTYKVEKEQPTGGVINLHDDPAQKGD